MGAWYVFSLKVSSQVLTRRKEESKDEKLRGGKTLLHDKLFPCFARVSQVLRNTTSNKSATLNCLINVFLKSNPGSVCGSTKICSTWQQTSLERTWHKQQGRQVHVLGLLKQARVEVGGAANACGTPQETVFKSHRSREWLNVNLISRREHAKRASNQRLFQDFNLLLLGWLRRLGCMFVAGFHNLNSKNVQHWQTANAPDEGKHPH